MKTKTIALLEIAIVLCSVFLVALPVIAAAASEIYEPGLLDVYGNANEDDTIDMRDTTYIKLVIFGKKPKTKLADANYDGKVSMLDVGQTNLIILGKEKELTFIDIFGEAETVNKPINRLVNLGGYGPYVTRALGARDILVAIGSLSMKEKTKFCPEISKLPAVKDDYEKIISLKPDAVQTSLEMKKYAKIGLPEKRELQEKLPGIPLISLNMREQDVLPQNLRTYGYILDREDEAEEFIDWIEKYDNLIKSRTEGLSQDDRSRVYFESHGKPYHIVPPGCRFSLPVVAAGGRNIADVIIGPDHPAYGKSWFIVDPEWVIEQNPEYIFTHKGKGYETDDPSEVAAEREKILNRPELANVNAVKNGHVYTICYEILGGAGNTIIGEVYMAKMFHPELFKDINPQEIHQEYVDKFCHIDFNVKEHGVFWYPPLEK
jgi:iron complex transport system substrate-binding protein